MGHVVAFSQSDEFRSLRVRNYAVDPATDRQLVGRPVGIGDRERNRVLHLPVSVFRRLVVVVSRRYSPSNRTRCCSPVERRRAGPWPGARPL